MESKRCLSYNEQITEHVAQLRASGLDVLELEIDSRYFVTCCDINGGREKVFAYKTQTRDLRNGDIGLITCYRSGNDSNASKVIRTYSPREDGFSDSRQLVKSTSGLTSDNAPIKSNESIAKKAYSTWMNANETGESPYLMRKKVGSYGLRFEETRKYGKSAIVPLINEFGRLMNIEFLNEDGTKRVRGDGSDMRNYLGLFHVIGSPQNGNDIGIAESYVTAATCFELSNIPIADASSASNLIHVGKIMRQKYPSSRIIFFADNDRHNVVKGLENTGLIHAQKAADILTRNAFVVYPDFEEIVPAKDASDWNDLLIHRGFDYAKEQILQKISLLPVVQSRDTFHEVDCEISPKTQHQDYLFGKSKFKDPELS